MRGWKLQVPTALTPEEREHYTALAKLQRGGATAEQRCVNT